jgi:hypothetical protein
MASPLSIFRKYQYLLLVAFGIMLMFAFVIAPPLDNYLRSMSAGGTGANPTVMTWKYGKVTEADLSQMRSIQLLTATFVRQLIMRVELTEAVPVTVGGKQVQLIKQLTYPLVGSGSAPDGDPTFRIVVQGEMVDIPQSAARRISPKVPPIQEVRSEEELIEKMLLAKKAEQLGVVVDEQAIMQYLSLLCDASNPPSYSRVLQEATRGKLSDQQLMAQLQQELLAQRMQVMSRSGFFAAPPYSLFDCYNRMNRRIKAELLPVTVASFVDEVAEPTDREIQAMYESGKDRFPLSSSPEPGFKHRQQIAFGYFKGDFEAFLNAELETVRPTITDEAIEQYYQQNKETEFKIPELPPAEDPASTGDEEDAPADEAPADTGAETGGDGAAEPMPGPAVTPPADAPAGTTEEPTGEPPANSETPPNDGAAAENPADAPATAESPDDPAEEPEKSDPPKEDGTSYRDKPTEFLVSYTAQEPADPPSPTAEPAPATTDEPAADEPSSPADPAAPSLDAPAATTEPAPAAASGSAEDPAAMTEEPSSASAETPAAQPATTEPVAETPAGDANNQAPTGSEESESVEPPAKYKPLDDELREQIRETLADRQARPAAEAKLDESISEARDVIRDYARELLLARQLDEVAEPDPLNYDAIAERLGLEYQQTPLLDVIDVIELRQSDSSDTSPPYRDFANATERIFDQQVGIVERSIADVGFGDGVEIFTPRRLVDGFVSQTAFGVPPDAIYLYWRIEDKPESVPALEDIREEVIAACKQKAALPLAENKATELADAANQQGDKSLKEVFPDQASTIIASDEFSWLTRGAVAMGSGGFPSLSQVTGTVNDQPTDIPGAGSEFMKSVFALDVNEVGTAVNQPETVVFVVRVLDQAMSDDERRELFFAGGLNQDVANVLQIEQSEVIQEWYDDLEKEMQVAWKRDLRGPWEQTR